MADITKTLSACVVTRMNKREEYTEDEKLVFEYGIELILNSVLKIFVYIIIGILTGQKKEVMIAIGLFAVLRKFSGGRHAKSDMGCFTIMGIILFSSVVIPYVIVLSKIQYFLIALIVWNIYLIYAPMDEYYLCEEHMQEKRLQKIKVIVVVGIILVVGFCTDQYWSLLILFVCTSQAITLIGFQKKH